MKVTPVATSGAVPLNPNEGTSASPDRVARAKAALDGAANAPVVNDRAPMTPQDPNLRRIKMKTQQTVNRIPEAIQDPAATTDTLATTEQATAPAEDTTAPGPQFVDLAKAKRALQAKDAAIAELKQTLASLTAPKTDMVPVSDLQSNTLSVLQKHGVTYDQLTEQLLSQNQTVDPIQELKAELAAQKELLNKTLSDRDANQEQQVLKQMHDDVQLLISQGDEYEAVREAGYGPKVVDLMHQVWKQENKLMSMEEAASLIENELVEQTLKFSKLKKVQGKLNPSPQSSAQPQPAQTGQMPIKVMRTLTNRDGSSSTTMTRRERAIAVMEGRLQK